MKLLTWIRRARTAMRHKQAEKRRRYFKVQIMMEDAREFFAGKKTREESLTYRLICYDKIDAMSDDEILA